MATLRSILGIRDCDVLALRAGEQNQLMLDMDDVMKQRVPADGEMAALDADDERIYLDAQAAEDRIQRHREAVDVCAPSGAKLGLMQLMSGALMVTIVMAAFFGSHPGLWVLLAALLFMPQKVYRVPQEHVGPMLEGTEPYQQQTVIRESDEPIILPLGSGKRCRRRQLLLNLSPMVDGTDPRGTVHIAPRMLVLASAGYLAAYMMCASMFQLLLASNDTIKASYTQHHHAWLCSISWHNRSRLGNTSIAVANAVNSTMTNCSWSWPPYETFGLWDAAVDMPTFLYFLIPCSLALAIAGGLFALLPPRCYFSYDYASVVGPLGTLKPLAIRLIQRGEAAPPSARPVARASAIVATCIPIYLAAAVLPGIIHALPVLLASAYALSATLAPPSAKLAQPPADLLPMAGEAARRACYFPEWVFRPDSDKATRLRSIIIALLYTSCSVIVLAQCVWQSPMFLGWNELQHRRAGFAFTSYTWSLEDAGGGGASVSIWSNPMQRAWYREWGLYHVRTYLEMDARSNDQSSLQGLSQSLRVVDGDGALNSIVASTDNGVMSLVLRVLVQTAFYVIAILWLRRGVYLSIAEPFKARSWAEDYAFPSSRE
jgi:hypothetical protein